MRADRLAVIAVVVGAASWAVLRLVERSGGLVPALPWTAPVALVLLAVAVVAAGRPVRRWTRGDRSRPLDPLRAARVLVLARASAYAGAALIGFYAAQALLVLPDLVVEARRERFWMAGVAVLASGALLAAGWVVERWCALPPDDPSDDDPPDDDPSTTPHP